MPPKVAELEPLIHESGMKYLPTYGEGLKSRLACFGQVLNKPTFRDTETYRTEIRELPKVAMCGIPSFKMPDSADKWIEMDEQYAVYDTDTGEVYSTVSERYEPVQDERILAPFADIADERGLNTVGRTIRQRGKTRAYINLINPEYTVKLLDERDEDIFIGARLVNSHCADRGWGLMFFGVRMVCCNFNAWGHTLGEFTVRHVQTAENIREAYLKQLEGAIDKSEILRNKAHELSQMFLHFDEIEALAWATNASTRLANHIQEEFYTLVPETIKHPKTISAYDVWNGLNAGATWAGGANLTTLEQRTKGAERLWYTNLDTLIAEGQAIRAERVKEDKAQQKLEVRVVA